MSSKRPHILLITTDQQRGDCLGLDGHPVLQTPNLDALGQSGAFFRRGYTECPSCIPARRTLMSGQAPIAHGMVGYADGVEWNPAHTLAGELSNAGYQTEMVGKLHLWPHRKRFGFDHMRWADATHGWNASNDYIDWLVSEGAVHVEGNGSHVAVSHGVDANGWVGRPNNLAEKHTHTTWCVNEAIDFLIRRDPSTPFFLNVSFIDPHPPLTPPQFYYDRYVNEKLPMPVVGDWAKRFDGPQRGLDVAAAHVCLDERTMRYARAAYYGMINHIDDQVGRLLGYLHRNGLHRDTFVLFTSDHGEMLGDHHSFRKCLAYEGSARVPFLAKAPAWMGCKSGVKTSVPVGLQDIMPTLLDAAGVKIPETVTGKSLLPLMRGESSIGREILHGEHSPCYGPDQANQYITDGHMKFIWQTQNGREQLFDLDNDPNELHDIAMEAGAESRVAPWRARMVEQLRGRPEGFTDGKKLIAGRTHKAMVPAVA